MCGVFGIVGHPEAANLTYLGLHALQHRGQESAGIVTCDGARLHQHRAMGLVHDSFTPEALGRLQGRLAIGHVRYSTAGTSELRNAQPLAVATSAGPVGVAHNGNLTNAQELRAHLESTGSIFQTDSDTEVIVHLIARSTAQDLPDRIAGALRQVRGAYSLLFLTKSAVIAVRDPHGVRPLCVGRLPDGATVVASEPTAFDLIGADHERDLAPGEMLVLGDGEERRSLAPFPAAPEKLCVFEYVYFARPDSTIAGRNVYAARRELGRQLAREHPARAGVVVPVPDSGVPAAMGVAEVLGAPFELGLIRSHYVGRTFIEPQQSIRHFGVKLKLAPVRDVLAGKDVVVVDDSIVRGTTSRKIVKMIRDVGASSVHVRISSPPTRWPCFYGIDTPTRRELIAASHSLDEIARYLTCDSLGYLSLEGMLKAVGASARGHCHACFSGEYPIDFVMQAEEGGEG
ncbi:MAG: amidophosphoribosyltransferase [Deltaproteobacteria bacterium]|nr:amidophosphoribosyltransferase [Deltaproteobacteria bacterium]